MNFKRVRACYCHRKPCVCARWEARLAREGLAHLDYEDTEGNVLTGSKGSGASHPELGYRIKEREAERETRANVLRFHRFRTDVQRCVWAMHADGASTREIVSEMRASFTTVVKALRDVRADYAADAGIPSTRDQLMELAREADRATLRLFLSMLRRALTSPDELSDMIAEAEGIMSDEETEFLGSEEIDAGTG